MLQLLHIVKTHRQKVLYFLFCGLLLAIMPSCCADRQMKETLQAGNDLEQGLRNVSEEQYLIFAYVEYNRMLRENTVQFGNHLWDKNLTTISFATLVGVLLIIWLLNKRVSWLYKFTDGQPDILYNTSCLSAFSLNVASFYGYTLFDVWYVPVMIIAVGLLLMVVMFLFPLHTGWLTARWQKIIRWIYLAGYTIFTMMCNFVNQPLEITT